MKYSVIGLIVLGLVAAFSAAFLLAVFGGTQRNGGEEQTEVKILVATTDLPSVTVIEQDLFEEQSISVKDAPHGYISSPIQVLGRPLVRPIVEGQALTSDCFASSRRGVDMVSVLKEGKRAVTVELTHAEGLEGLLYPGCIVDVLATFDVSRRARGQEDMAVSTTLLHGVEVLAIDADTTSAGVQDDVVDTEEVKTGALSKTRRVTLLVDTDQAKALQLATEHGTVSLAMRNPLDKTHGDEDPKLLSGGRLARLAEYLEGSVSSPPEGFVNSHSSESSSTTRPDARRSRGNGAPQSWDVTIHRGNKVEVQSMTQELAPTKTVAAD